MTMRGWASPLIVQSRSPCLEPEDDPEVQLPCRSKPNSVRLGSKLLPKIVRVPEHPTKRRLLEHILELDHGPWVGEGVGGLAWLPAPRSCVQNLLQIGSWFAVVGPVGNAERCPQGEWVGSGCHAQGLLLVLPQIVHVEVAVRLQPVLVHLDR